MAHYIDKDALIAEIQRKKIPFKKDIENGIYPTYFCALMDFENFINTLEVKDVNLKEYYHEFLQREWFGNSHVRTVSEMMAFTAKHFFELGLKVQREE